MFYHDELVLSSQRVGAQSAGSEMVPKDPHPLVCMPLFTPHHRILEYGAGSSDSLLENRIQQSDFEIGLFMKRPWHGP